MWQIFIGSLVLSIIHASIPNHWLPLIAIGKTEKWTTRETMLATAITGLSHTLSTVMIGIIVGFIGYKLAGSYQLISGTIAPTILVLIGLVYIVLHFRHSHHDHEHSHSHNKSYMPNKPKLALLLSLSIAMFLTPCVELEAYYFQAGTIGWAGILIVSVVYTLTTVILMLVLVYLGKEGISKFRSHYLEHHEKLVTGVVLIVLGLFGLFFKL
jgi:nickel/cobalt transporter (NicO) family protein